MSGRESRGELEMAEERQDNIRSVWRGEEKEIVRGVLLGGELSEIGR